MIPMMIVKALSFQPTRILITLMILGFVHVSSSPVHATDAVDRLTAEWLEAVHQAVLKLKSERRDIPRSGPLREYRANLHVHSALSVIVGVGTGRGLDIVHWPRPKEVRRKME